MNLQPFSVNDGEGIRTTIFLAGCPLRCAWCSNPEGFECREVVGWYRHRCTGCGACQGVHPEACLTGARTWMVRRVDADDILTEIQKHRLFYAYSGGGITFSGGEATAQPAFLDYLSREIYDMGYSMAIETCGYFDFDNEKIRASLARMDMIFIDLKCMDDEIHRKYTGVSNQRILDNIRRLSALHAKSECTTAGVRPTEAQQSPGIVVRIPVIGGVNDSEDNLRRSACFVHKALPDARMELLPYHKLGSIKYEALELPFPDEFQIPSATRMDRLREIVLSEGVDLADFR